MQEVREILKNNPYFNNLSNSELIELEEIINIQNYDKNEIIFFEGEQGQGLFFIIDGKVKLVKMTKNGGEQILHILKRGEVFAEVVLFDKGQYPATAVALEESKIGLIKHEKMDELIQKKPQIAIKLLKVMSKRLRRAQEKIRNFGLKNAASRLASIIIYLMDEHGQKENNQITINLPLTQEELSNMAGVSRETISRILTEFEEKGFIDVGRKQIIVKNADKLNKVN